MMKRVIGVRFKKAGRMYYFDPVGLEINEGDGVIVETARGMEYGEVVLSPRDIPEEQIVAPLKDVMRIATDDDHDTHERNLQLEAEAFDICQEKIASHGLDMKLVDVEYTFNGSKITFFFTAEGRVDFRELVKDLAFVFKTRIELRQIGVRDEAKMLGGLGSCGRPVCCKTFLDDFQPVSIKMAKEQKLSLSPTKISGLCGRLMCCLKYEQDAYESMRKLMPRTNKEVITPDGRGIVLDNNVITEKTKVRITLNDGTPDVREYHFTDIRRPGTPDEEESVRQELVASVQARAQENEPEEEEFRFVTGHVPEEKEPAAPAQPVQKEQQREPDRRNVVKNKQRHRNSQNASDTEQPVHAKRQPEARHAQSRPQNAPQQPRPQQNAQIGPNAQNPQNGQSAQNGQNGQQGQPSAKPHRSRRGGRNRRRKPAGDATAQKTEE